MAANIDDAVSSLTAQLTAGAVSLEVYTAAIAAMPAAVGRQAVAAPNYAYPSRSPSAKEQAV
jgi:hypothetical protein